MRLLSHPQADRELVEATAHYVKQRPSRAGRFTQVASGGLALIAENPYVGRRRGRRARGYVLKRFPYTIFYEIRSDHVLIAAFAPQSRRPGHWRERLEREPHV